MKPFTLTEAMRETKRAKSTIIDAIKNGRLSAGRDDKGRYLIDPAELFRCYPRYDDRTDVKTDSVQETTQLTYQLSELKIQSLIQQLDRERELNRDLARRLDESDAERRKLTKLLTFQQEQPAKVQEQSVKKENKLWKKLFR
jgi:Skp family chaperone for outer membrane proteins